MMGFETGGPVRCQRAHQPTHVILDIAAGSARPQILPGPVHAIALHLLLRGLPPVSVRADTEPFPFTGGNYSRGRTLSRQHATIVALDLIVMPDLIGHLAHFFLLRNRYF